MNYLHLGDCLNVLRESVNDEVVDLIYIDPPFNSKRDYSMFFDDKEIHTQRIAFEDTWSLKNIGDSVAELHTLETDSLYKLLETYREVAPHAFPYLVMMGLRIVELHRVLRKTGSFYLHCDPTMSHYLKTVCDVVFGVGNFRNEIIWRRTNAHNKTTQQYGPIHDSILFYSKSADFVFHPATTPYSKAYIEDRFTKSDARGRYQLNYLTGPEIRYGESGKEWRGFNPTAAGRHWAIPKSLVEFLPSGGDGMSSHEKLDSLLEQDLIVFPKKIGGQPMYKQYVGGGVFYQDLWTYQPNTRGTLYQSDECIDEDVKYLEDEEEKLDYPTQKPRGLLERIIKSSCPPDGLVLDAFCGCGTTVEAAEGLGMRWIGIDISPGAITLIKSRLVKTFKENIKRLEVRGIPTSEASAKKLWEENPWAFQDWWVMEFGAFSPTQGTKGADRGVDGIAMYAIGVKGETIRAAFQVKGGKVQSKDIDALLGTMKKMKCELGVFLTIEEPTKPMLSTIAGEGFWKSEGIAQLEYPRIQILTLADFFGGKEPKLPRDNVTFAAARFKGKQQKQESLEL